MRALILLIGIVATTVSAVHFGSGRPRSATASADAPSTFVDRLQQTIVDDLPGLRGQAAASAFVADAASNAAAYVASIPDPDDTLREASRASREYRYAEAASMAQWVLRVHGTDLPAESHTRASLSAGYAALQNGDAAVARDILVSVEGVTEELDGFRQLWLARACLAAGDFACAGRAGDLAAAELTRDIGGFDAAFISARAGLRTQADPDHAIGRLRGLLDEFPDYPYANTALIEIAEAHARNDDESSAARIIDDLLWRKPWTPLAPRAAALRYRLDVPEPRRTFQQRLEQATNLRRWRQWTLADAALLSMLEDATTNEERASVREELMLTSYEDARFEDTLRWADELTAHSSPGVSSQTIGRWRARAQGRLGLGEVAYATLLESLGPNLARSDHDTLGEFAFDLGLWNIAVRHRREHWSQTQWVDFDGGFLLYLSGDLTGAESVFSRQFSRSSGSTRARYGYWLARTWQKMDRLPAALELWDEIAQDRPFEYYGVQARNRIADATTSGPSAAGRVTYAGQGHAPDGALDDLPPSVRNRLFDEYPSVNSEGALRGFAERWGAYFPSARVAADLFDLGALEEARRTFRDTAFEFRSLNELFDGGREVSTRRPITFTRRLWFHEVDNRREEEGWWGTDDQTRRYPAPSGTAEIEAYVARHGAIRDNRQAIEADLIAAVRDVGDPFFTRRIALTSGLSDLPAITDADRIRWQDAFPHAYARRMRSLVEARNLNPYLFWSLILVESAFNPDTVSIADAFGLTQVIPKTGELVVERMGFGDVGVHALLEPDSALAFGSYYLSELLYKFHGQEMLACVAYNAGAYAVARWLDWRGEHMEMDEFIESVPYTQSRRYAQRIVQHMSTYRWVHEGTPDLYIGNRLDAIHEPNINF
jgi:soluble lytic murein transglycosylase-like protein